MKAFSLIELMVVIAITALLAAIAVPAYQSYKGKVQLVTAIDSVTPLLRSMQKTYQSTGSYPNPINFKGVNINMYSGGTVNINNITTIQYSNRAPDQYGRMIILNFASGGIASVPAPARAIGIGIRDVNGVIKIACGNPNNGQTPFPSDMLPATCQCTNVDQWAVQGLAATGCP